MRFLPFAVTLLACSTSAADLPDSAAQSRASNASPASADTTAAGAGTRDTAAASAGATAPAAAVQPAGSADLPIIRGLYVNRFAAQSLRRMRRLIDIADSTEINAVV